MHLLPLQLSTDWSLLLPDATSFATCELLSASPSAHQHLLEPLPRHHSIEASVEAGAPHPPTCQNSVLSVSRPFKCSGSFPDHGVCLTVRVSVCLCVCVGVCVGVCVCVTLECFGVQYSGTGCQLSPTGLQLRPSPRRLARSGRKSPLITSLPKVSTAIPPCTMLLSLVGCVACPINVTAVALQAAWFTPLKGGIGYCMAWNLDSVVHAVPCCGCMQLIPKKTPNHFWVTGEMSIPFQQAAHTCALNQQCDRGLIFPAELQHCSSWRITFGC